MANVHRFVGEAKSSVEKISIPTESYARRIENDPNKFLRRTGRNEYQGTAITIDELFKLLNMRKPITRIDVVFDAILAIERDDRGSLEWVLNNHGRLVIFPDYDSKRTIYKICNPAGPTSLKVSKTTGQTMWEMVDKPNYANRYVMLRSYFGDKSSGNKQILVKIHQNKSKRPKLV